jgi:hypothetical protein
MHDRYYERLLLDWLPLLNSCIFQVCGLGGGRGVNEAFSANRPHNYARARGVL